MTLNKKHCLIFLTVFVILLIGATTVSAAADTNKTEVIDNKELSTPTNNDVDNMVQSSQSTTKLDANVEKTITSDEENKTTKTITKKDTTIQNTKQETETKTVTQYSELRTYLTGTQYSDLTIILEDDLTSDAAITVNSAIKNLIIEGNSKTINGNSRAFLTVNNMNLTIKNVTITNCAANNAPVISSTSNSNITILDSNITNCRSTSTSGGTSPNNGVLYITNGIVTLERNLFEGNSVSGTTNSFILLVPQTSKIVNNTFIDNINTRNSNYLEYDSLINRLVNEIHDNTYVGNHLSITLDFKELNLNLHDQTEIYDDVVFNLYVLLNEYYNDTVKNGTIHVDTSDDKTFDVPVVEGVAHIEIDYSYIKQQIDTGSYSFKTIWFSYYSLEDHSYESTISNSTNFIAETMRNPTLTASVTPKNDSLGNNFTIKGTLKTNTGDPMPANRVTLTIGDEVFTGNTDVNGEVYFIYTPSRLGVHTGTVTVAKHGGISNAKTSSVEFTVEGDPSYISINLNETEVTGAQPVKVYGVLTNMTGESIGGATVNLTFKNQYKASTTTDPVTGEYSFDYVTDVADNTENNIKVVYGGDLENGINGTSNSTKLTVNPYNTNITINATDTQYGGSTNITGYVYDVETGDIIQTGQVSISITNVNNPITANIVDGKFETQRSMTNLGTKTVTVTYVASGLYASSVNSTQFTVTKGITNITINTNGPIKPGSQLTVSGYLLNDFGAYIGSRQYINVTVGNQKSSPRTSNTGSYTATFTLTEVDDYDIIVEFLGTTNYFECKNTTVFSVYKIPTITNVSVVNDKINNVTIDVSVRENDTKFKDNITSGKINVTVGENSKLYDITGKTTRIVLDGDVNITTTDEVDFKVEFVETTVDLNSTGINSTTGEVITKFTAQPIFSNITVYVTPVPQNITYNVTIYGEVFDEFGSPVEEGTVTIDINNTPAIPVPFTGGRYEYNFTTVVAGEIPFNVTFNASKTESGNILIQESKNFSTFKVDKLPTITNVDLLNNSYNNVTIRVNVTSILDEDKFVTLGWIDVYDFIYTKPLASAVDVSNKYADITLPLEPGINKVLIYFNENAIYLESNARNESAFSLDKDLYVINVEKIPSVTNVEKIVNNKSGEVTLRINVTNTTDDLVTTGHVLVLNTSNGEVLGEGDLINGRIDITLDGVTEPGDIQVNVTYTGNEYYLPSNATGYKKPVGDNVTVITVTIDPKISIELDKPVVVIGDEVIISGMAYNQTDKPYMDYTSMVEISINDQKVPAELDQETVYYQLKYTPTANGTYTITASFIIGDEVIVTSEELELLVNKINSTTSVRVVNNTAGNVTVEISIRGADGNTTMTGEAIITFDGNKVIPLPLNGQTSYLETIHGINRTDNFDVIVTFKENEKYYSSSNETSITAVNQTPILEVGVIQENVAIKSNAVIIGNLSDDTGNKLAGAYIEIVVDGQPAGTVKTNSTGGFTLEYPTTKLGKIIVNATYLGDNNRYSNATDNTHFNVILISDYILPIMATNITYGDSETITVTLPIDAQGTATISIEGTEISQAVPVNNGKATLTIDFYELHVGEFTASVSFNDDNYDTKTNSTKFNISKAESHVDVSVSTITMSYNETVIVTLPEYEYASGNISVTITKDDEIIEEYLIEAGDLIDATNITVIENLIQGTYTVNVIYTNDTNYNDSTKTATFEVVLPEIKIFDDATIYVDESVLIHGIVTDTNNNEIKGKIRLNVNGTTETLTHDEYEKGISKQFTEAGEYTINATYIVDDKDIVTSKNIIITVEKIETSTILSIVNNTLGNVVVNVEVFGNDQPVTTGNIEVIDAVTGQVLGEGSIENGEANIILEVDTPGTLSINATYNENYKYNASASATERLEVKKIDANITINLAEDTLTIGDTVIIYGTVTDSTGKVLTEGTVTIKINNTEYTVPVNSNGEYRLNNLTNVSGTFTVNATYNIGTYTNPVTSINKEYTVNKIPTDTSIIIKDDKVNTTSIEVTVTDNNKNPVTTGTLKVTTPTETFTVPVTQETTSIPITTTADTTIKITVEYQENNKYNTSNATKDIPVTKHDTTITVTVTTPIKAGNTTTITGLLVDENNKVINGAKIEIKVDNKSIANVTTDNNGNYKTTVNDAIVGTHNVEANYAGDNKYTGNSDTTSFTVEKLETSVSINKITDVPVGESVVITGKLVDENNKAVTDMPVKVSFDGKTTTVTTDKDGNYKATYTATTVGNKEVTAIFTGNSKYDASTTNNTAKVVKNNATITLTLPSNSKVGEPATITGKVTDKNKNALTDMPVDITVNGKTVKTVTDDKGNFEAEVTPVEGNNPITAKSGNENYDIKDAAGQFTATRKDAKLTLDPVKDSKLKDNITVTGKLVDEQNKPLSYEPVKVTVNGKTTTVTTDENGNYQLPLTNVAEGTNNITVKYEDTQYKTQSKESTFKATKSKTKVTVSSITGVIGEDITLTAYVTDDEGNPISGGNLVFKLNGRTLRTDGRFDTNNTSPLKLSVKDGIVTYTIKADLYLRNGKNITASYSGSSKYDAAKANVATANIKKRNAQVIVKVTPKNSRQNTDVVFSATLNDVTPNATNDTSLITDANIIFKVNGVTIKNSSGEANRIPVTHTVINYVYHVPTGMGGVDENGVKNYTVEAVYDNPVFYPDTRNSSVLNVIRSQVNINFIKTSVKNNVLSVKANLTDFENKYVVGNSNVCVKINGVTYKENGETKYFTVKNGRVDLTGIKLASGTKIKSVMLVSGAREGYLGARATTTDIITS